MVDESLIAIGGQRRPACFSHDGRLVFAGSVDGPVKIWDWETGRRVAELPLDQPGTTAYVVASPDGTRIVTSNSRGETRFWDATTKQRVGDLLYGRWAASSPSSNCVLLLHSDGARVRDARTAVPLSAPMLHRGVGIRTAAFSADGRCVVTAAHDSTARIWDAATGRPLTDPLRHDSRVVGCGFSPDRRFVQTEEAGHMASRTDFRVWSVPPDAENQPIPDWLLQLATILAERRINTAGRCVGAPEALAGIDELRRTVAALPDDAPFVQWGRWILDDRPDRSIAPGFSVTQSGAERLARELAQ